jgi:GAF domain-containing protein
MNKRQTTRGADIGSDSLLAAYHLLIETVVESVDDDELLQRALAVIAAIPWPWTHRYFAACVPGPNAAALRLAAFVAGPGVTAPHCDGVETTACLCGLALVRHERLIRIDAARKTVRSPCACADSGIHLVLPLAARGRVLGMLHIALEPGRTPGEQEQSFLVLVATLLGAELDRRRSEQGHDRLEMQFLQRRRWRRSAVWPAAAHDFNNILTAITSYADLGLLKLPRARPLRRNFEEILEASDRAALLTQQLLAFSHRQPLAPRVIDVGELLGGLGKPLRRLLGADVELSLRSDPGAARILADPSLIEQLVINLALGARDALPRGGKVRIEAADVELDAAFALAHPLGGAGRHLCLVFGVEGPGCLRRRCGRSAPGQGGPHPEHARSGRRSDIIRQSGDTLTCMRPRRRCRDPHLLSGRGPGRRAERRSAGADHLPRGSERSCSPDDDSCASSSPRSCATWVHVLEACDGRAAQDLADRHVGP